MPRSTINWDSPNATLPLNTGGILFNSGTFRRELLPYNQDISRKVKQICTLCTNPPYSQILPADNHTNTGNLWRHLKTKHKASYIELTRENNSSNIELSSSSLSIRDSRDIRSYPLCH
jgi:hypothetical protein